MQFLLYARSLINFSGWINYVFIYLWSIAKNNEELTNLNKILAALKIRFISKSYLNNYLGTSLFAHYADVRARNSRGSLKKANED